MPQSRQLAAIMFTDIVGYTALMGEDEDKAFELLNKSRLLHKPIIEKYGGKWIKELGDGVLATFSTVTDAVFCACSIIKGCEDIEGLQLRIGIHQSEVVFENDDVFGDGVNIASRLQSLAPIGGICISETVRNNVANRKEIQTRFVKEETLKHVKEPVRIYEVIVDCAEPMIKSPTKLADKEPTKILIEKSIAVLPFVNMSNDPEQQYF
ncbi:MAG: adenylate/guanylate cyclase domain-containing protein, partial [Chitinophagaceae bacterium]